MSRVALVLLFVLTACGPMPSMPDGGASINLGGPTSPDPSPSPMTSGSATVLGPCTGTDGSSCGNGRGICVSSMNIPGQKQCLLRGTVSAPCPRGTFGAQYTDGLPLCLDLCTSVRDCAAGFFCNPTVLGDERGTSQSVKVCMPGAINHAGMNCDVQSDCELASTELTCAGGSNSQTKICTRSCTTTADCGPNDGSLSPVCARTTTGSGICVRPCTPGPSSFCGTGLTCSPGGHCLPTPSSGGSGSTTFPTPGFGSLGGGCGANNDCEGRYACLTSRPGGLCTATCRSSAECGTGECVDQQGMGVCFAKCSTPGTQSNCRAGYQCRALQGRSYGICS